MNARTPATEDHEQKITLVVDVMVPGHAARGDATPLFHRTRLQLIEREGGRCWLSGLTAQEVGAPLEAHHYPVERCFAEKWDWPRFAKDCKAGHWGPHAQAFEWDTFLTAQPFDPYAFVDNMLVNGRLLSKQFHTGPNEGIHCLPEPIYLAQKYLTEGYKFSDIEIIHHSQD